MPFSDTSTPPTFDIQDMGSLMTGLIERMGPRQSNMRTSGELEREPLAFRNPRHIGDAPEANLTISKTQNLGMPGSMTPRRLI